MLPHTHRMRTRVQYVLSLATGGRFNGHPLNGLPAALETQRTATGTPSPRGGVSKMGLNGHRGRAGVCPCAGWHRVGQWAARGIKGSLGGYAAGRRTLPALADLVYYQEAQYSRLLPVTTSRYVTLPVTLNGGYFRRSVTLRRKKAFTGQQGAASSSSL